MTIEEAIRNAATAFEAKGIESPMLESEFLMASLLGYSRAQVLMKRKSHLQTNARQRFNEWVLQRGLRKPLAYVTGEQPFFGLSFKVTSDVLIPRPETEILVEEALKLLKDKEGPLTIVDVGTGSGVIAVSLAYHLPNARVIGIDVSDSALTIAAQNAQANGVPQCEWKQGDLLTSLKREDKAQMILANLPYVRRKEMTELAPELHWEPRLALDGGISGLTLIHRLIQDAPLHLCAGGYLLLEIGADQGKAVQSILAEGKIWEEVTILRDLEGHERVIRAKKGDSWIC